MQSRRDSMVEVLTNTAVGFVGSWIITWLSFKYVPQASVAATVSVVGCTVWSLVRGYSIRRHFAKKLMKEMK